MRQFWELPTLQSPESIDCFVHIFREFFPVIDLKGRIRDLMFCLEKQFHLKMQNFSVIFFRFLLNINDGKVKSTQVLRAPFFDKKQRSIPLVRAEMIIIINKI
jgi:hypothetical protein